MKKNVGSADRIIRLIIAAVLAGAYFGGYVTGTLGIVALVVAVVMLGAAAIGFCPLYTIIGMNTCGCAKPSTPGEGEAGGSCCGTCGGDGQETDANEPPKLS